MKYVNGMVAAVSDKERDAYIKHAREVSALFRKYGAERIVDCWGSDVPDGKLTSFPMAVKKQDGESVVFTWIEWPSKQAMDEGWEKIMQDERMHAMKMPFDGKRMIYGSFEMIVDE